MASPSPHETQAPAAPTAHAALPGDARGLLLLVLGVGALLVAFGVLLVRMAPELPPDLGKEARVLPVPLEIPPFSLVDHRGAVFDNARLEGRFSLLFFGYTSCPDICPTTLQRLAEVEDRLPADTQVVFVSVDPDRDAGERLGEYVGWFHPDLIGVTGDAGQIDVLTGAVGAFHRKEAVGDDPRSYLVDHSAELFVVSPEGRLHALMQDPHEPEEFLSLLDRVRALHRGAS